MSDKLKDKSVLIVDDDERNTFALLSYLETLEMKISVAKNGSEAITRLQESEKIDIILLDMMMPVMDGFETLAAIQKNDAWKQIPVIAVTAKAMKGDKEKCLQAGAWDYVAKPLDMQTLLDKMTRWV